MRPFGPTLAVFAIAKAAICAPDDFPRALQLLDAKQFAASAAILQRLVESHATNALYWFNLASARFNAGDFAAAATAFRRVLELRSPLAPGARLCLAMALRRQGDLAGAAEALRQAKTDTSTTSLRAAEEKKLAAAWRERAAEALDRKDNRTALAAWQNALEWQETSETRYGLGLTLVEMQQPEEARAQFSKALALQTSDEESDHHGDARFFLERLGEGASKPYWLSLDEGVGYDSNVFLSGISQSGVGKAVAETALSAGGEARAHAFYGRLTYQLYSEETLGYPAGRFLAQTARAQAGWEGADWSFRVTPGVQHQIFGTSSYELRALAGAGLQRNLGRSAIGVQYEYSRNYAQSAEFSYLDGNTHAASAYFDYLGAEISVRLGYAVYFENSGDLISGSYVLPLADTAQGPFLRGQWRLDQNWEWTAAATYLFRDYRTRAEPDNVARQDSQLTLYARLAYSLSPTFALFSSVNGAFNESTLGDTSAVSDRNYWQILAVAGVSWKIL